MLYNLSKTYDTFDFTEPCIIYNCYKSININDNLLKINTTSLHSKKNYWVIRCWNNYKLPVYFIKISNRIDYKHFLILLNHYQKHTKTQNTIISQNEF